MSDQNILNVFRHPMRENLKIKTSEVDGKVLRVLAALYTTKNVPAFIVVDESGQIYSVLATFCELVE